MRTSTTFPLVVTLALEFNHPSKKVIQIGAVLGDLQMGDIVSRFSCYVNPDEVMNPNSAILAGITQETLEAAPDIEGAYLQMADWLKPHESNRSLIPLVWGGKDNEALCKALGLKPSDAEWCFGPRSTDIKRMYALCRGYPWLITFLMSFGLESMLVGTLASCVEKLGMTFEGTPYNALHNAENAFHVYIALIRQIQPGAGAPVAS
ncbi:MAG: exonuclease domain-containing protein [Proteobacteria bacterium]|nr:exonuclease domain-containing protein [Pseudomonadota bacterium]